MSELTLEKFEQILEKKLDNRFLSFEQSLDKKLDEKLDEKLKDLATKQDVTIAVDELARIVNFGFSDQQMYLERLDHRLDIVEHKVDSKFTKLEHALQIKL